MTINPEKCKDCSACIPNEKDPKSYQCAAGIEVECFPEEYYKEHKVRR